MLPTSVVMLPKRLLMSGKQSSFGKNSSASVLTEVKQVQANTSQPNPMGMTWSTSQRSRQEIKYKVKDETHEARSPLGGVLVGLVHHGPSPLSSTSHIDQWTNFSLVPLPPATMKGALGNLTRNPSLYKPLQGGRLIHPSFNTRGRARSPTLKMLQSRIRGVANDSDRRGSIGFFLGKSPMVQVPFSRPSTLS